MPCRRLPLQISVFLLLLVLGTSRVFAGGFSGSGGGGGVICFAKTEEAVKADRWLNANKALPDEFLARGDLHILEAWEMVQLGNRVWPADLSGGKTWRDHLGAVEGVLRADLPLFMYRLDQVGDWAELLAWRDLEDLSLLDDAKPVAKIPPNCRRIQLAVRYSSGNNARGEGPPVGLPKVRVIYSKRYFDRLPETEKAMLVFHEKLYMLGQAVGHTSSDVIRTFVRIFFDDSVAKKQGQPGQISLNDGLFTIKDYLIRFFGDYIGFFSDHYRVVPGAVFTSQHQFSTFFAFQRRERAKMEKCAAGDQPEKCLRAIMDPLALEDELTPEESFLYFIFFGMERTFRKINADQVLDPTGRDPKNFALAMQLSCSAVEYHESRFISEKIMRKAVSYCQSWQRR